MWLSESVTIVLWGIKHIFEVLSLIVLVQV